MTALERMQAEIDRLVAISQRRALWDDERLLLKTYLQVKAWMAEEAAPAPVAVAAPSEPEAPMDEHQKTKDVFASYRDKLKKEGRMR